MVIITSWSHVSMIIAQSLIYSCCLMTYHFWPQKLWSNKKSKPGEKRRNRSQLSSCLWPEKFQVGSFYLQHLHLGVDGWWGCKAGGIAKQYGMVCDDVYAVSISGLSCWVHANSWVTITVSVGMLLRSQLIIALRSSPRWGNEWTCFVGKESVWSFPKVPHRPNRRG